MYIFRLSNCLSLVQIFPAVKCVCWLACYCSVSVKVELQFWFCIYLVCPFLCDQLTTMSPPLFCFAGHGDCFRLQSCKCFILLLYFFLCWFHPPKYCWDKKIQMLLQRLKFGSINWKVSKYLNRSLLNSCCGIASKIVCLAKTASGILYLKGPVKKTLK